MAGVLVLLGAGMAAALYAVAGALSTMRGENALHRADALSDSGKFAEAIPVFDHALRESLGGASLPRAYLGRGWALTKVDRDPEAIRDFNAALQLQPDLLFARLDRGLAFHRLGLYDQALADYDKTVALDRNNVDAYRNRALILAQRGRMEEAIADMNEAVRCAPFDPRWLVRRGHLYLMAGRLEAALASFESAIYLRPEMAEGYYGRAEVRIAQGAFARAKDELTDAIHAQPRSGQLYLARAFVHAELDELEPAVEDSAKAIELKKDLAIAYAMRAMLEVRLGGLEAALAFARLALELDAKLPLPYLVRARVHDSRREFREISDFDEALRLSPDYVDAVVWRALAESHAGLYRAAAQDFDKATQTFAGLPLPHLMRAWFLSTCPEAEFRDGGRAVEEAKIGTKLGRENALSLDVLATAFAEAGDFAAAIECEQKSLDRTPAGAPDCLRMEARLREFQCGLPHRDLGG